MREGRRIEALLGRDRRAEARAALEAASGAEGDPWLRLLQLWVLDREKGPGHVVAGLEAWSPPAEGDPDRPRALCLAAALRSVEALRTGGPTCVGHALEAADRLPDDAPWLELVVASVLQGGYRMTGRLGSRSYRRSPSTACTVTRLPSRSTTISTTSPASWSRRA